MYGAFVAGLKAGKIHATFPKMGDSWFPKIITEQFSKNGFISFFDDSYLIIFIHRWLAVIVTLIVFYIIYQAKNCAINTLQKTVLKLLLIAISIQFLLGVFTILFKVPVVLGVLHQFGAMLFLLSTLSVIYFFKKPIT